MVIVIKQLTNFKKKSSPIYFQKLYTTIPKNKHSFKKIPFIPHTAFHITRTLKKLNITPAFYTHKTLKKQLINNKIDKRNKLEKCGVYGVKCNICLQTYIGQTGRSFSTRLSEHINAVKNENILSNIADHIRQTNHHISSADLSVLHIEGKGRRLDLLEAYEINKAKKRGIHLLNDQINLCSSPILNIMQLLHPYKILPSPL